ncbi:MAG: DUF3142 domain-containing protein [Desulfobulbaceae bacterium]|nr:DUF3142 domain-containing protein [Desulfobulbaceae bacterium]
MTRTTWLTGAALSVLLVAASFSFFQPPAALEHCAYIWQRKWTPQVGEAVQTATPHMAGFAVLAAEISFDKTGPSAVFVQPDYHVLRSSSTPVVLCLRIGSWSGPFAGNDNIAHFVSDTIGKIIRNAENGGLQPEELQIDFDCGSAQLTGYAIWLHKIRRELGNIRLSFTALPDWLQQPDFPRLIAEADCFVLQVHSLTQSPDKKGYTICEAQKAFEWAKHAALFQKQFYVALPTHGYRLTMDQQGRVLDVTAEESDLLPQIGEQRQTVFSDWREMSMLVKKLTQESLLNLRGIMWYRLPVAGDRLNWSLPTLLALVSGRDPISRVRVLENRKEENLVELLIKNEGETVIHRASFRIAWEQSELLAADSLSGFTMERGDKGVIMTADQIDYAGLYPGEQKTVAWLRFYQRPTLENTMLFVH